MNGYGNSVFLRTAFEVSGGVPPVNTVAPAITGTAQEGETVTCSTGTWTGTPTITFAYQWKRNGSNIGSATNSTYVLVTADVAQSITCQVTATNGFGSASATSNTITPIAAVDPDAQAFITAAAITNPTQQAAINTLVVDLKAASIWSKLLVFYPFVGGTALSNSKNLKNINFGTLTYSTGMTHGTLGIKGNGSSYADTGLKSTTIGFTQNNAASGVYMQTWATNQTMAYGHFGNLTMYKGLPALYPMINNGLAPTLTPSSFSGLFQMSRNSSANFLFKDKNATASTIIAASNALNSTLNLYVCFANNYNGVADWISCNYYATGLTETDLTNMYTAVQAFQTSLSRQV